ncbi:MAG TPA: sigma-54-dependent Fis family transcriptional regulator, partial [Candidatus Nanopelagicales bacterium]|nr:sigma-54-dependent Fis family transcriptional regulator [Candidatus Nanopelagicales bacterium]
MQAAQTAVESSVDSTSIIPSSRACRQPLDALVRVSGAAASPSALKLSQPSCIIGSGPGCDIVISDPTISRQHVELILAPEGVAVRDLGSTNGTFYLGHRVQEIVLAFGARFSIGRATVSIDLDPGALPEERAFDGEEYRGIVGRSPAMRRLFSILSRLEGSLVPVLIQGESGVGKELIARALHEGSPVGSGPLVTVNCGAVARELVASELFGHRKGAFTGALEPRKGAFLSADGGTLFLDEIGEMPLDVQPMVLRALESGEVRPVGSDQVRQVKTRVVAATNRDLLREV